MERMIRGISELQEDQKVWDGEVSSRLHDFTSSTNMDLQYRLFRLGDIHLKDQITVCGRHSMAPSEAPERAVVKYHRAEINGVIRTVKSYDDRTVCVV